MVFHGLRPTANMLAQDGQAIGRGDADHAAQTADAVMRHMGVSSVGVVLMICMDGGVRMFVLCGCLV